MRLLILILIVLLIESLATGVIPITRGYLYDYLADKNLLVYTALLFYILNIFILDIFQALKPYLILRLSLQKREERTKLVLQEELQGSNIPQRIQEDIKLSYLHRYTVYAEYFVSTTILIQLFILNISQPTLLIGSFTFAVISVFIAILFKGRLTFAEKTVQHHEASFRSSLIDNLKNGNMIHAANLACLKAGNIRLQYALFTKAQLCIMTTLPYIVLIPALLDGSITLGTLVEYSSVFYLIVVNASILISQYPTLITGKASEERIKEVIK